MDIAPGVDIDPGTTGPKTARWIRVWAAALTLLGSVYLVHGFAMLVSGPAAAGDLRIRWSAQQYVFERQNPYDVQARVWAEQEGRPAPDCPRPVAPREDLGAPGIVGEAPWSFVSGALLFGAPWPEARWVFAALNLLALGVVGRWAWTQGRPFGRGSAWLLCAAVLSLGSHATTLGVGQVGTLVVALLVLALILEERGRSLPAGLLLGVAQLKLNTAAPFVLPFFVRRRWRALAAAAVYAALASLLIWAWLDTSPIEFGRQMVWGHAILERRDAGLLAGLARLGLGGSVVITLLALTALALGALGMRRIPPQSTLVLFAVTSVVARVWTYHRVYDNSLLTFLLVALGVAWLRERSALLLLAFLAVGVSLWSPTRYADPPPVVVLHHAVWLGATSVLVLRARRGREPAQRTLREAPGRRPPPKGTAVGVGALGSATRSQSASE